MYVCVRVCVCYTINLFVLELFGLTPHLWNLLYPTAALLSFLSNCPIAVLIPTQMKPWPLHKLLKFCFGKHGILNKCWGEHKVAQTSPYFCTRCELLEGNCVGKWKAHLHRVKLSAPLCWMHSQHEICCNLKAREIHHSLHSSVGEHWVCVMGFLVSQYESCPAMKPV